MSERTAATAFLLTHTLYFFPFFHQSRKIPRVQIKDDLMRRSFQETFAYIADRRLLELLLVGLD